MIKPNHHDSQALRRQRLKVSIACQSCRTRKAKCDGGRPVCVRCQARGATCNYTRVPTVGQIEREYAARTSLKHAPILASPPASPGNSLEAPFTSTVLTPASIEPSPISVPAETDQFSSQDPENNRAYYTAHGRFAGQVAAAIDKRAGLIPPATAHLVPLVDAPLFGELDLLSRSCVSPLSTELPLRARANQLVDMYWRHIDPAEPILDRQQLNRAVEVSYSTPGASILADCDVWLAILNLVFALAVQRQESIPLNDRNEEGNRYFRRAWALLPAESILWRPASLELVQCLMLMNRYLHCTNNQQKTWMTSGLAVRLAQSICCHLPEMPSTKADEEGRRLKRKVWASCVALDRCVSWALGRQSASMLISAPTVGFNQEEYGHTKQPLWGLELHDIGNQIQLAQIQSRSSLAAKSAAGSLGPQEEYHAAVVRLDACLGKWEESLPTDWQLRNLRLVGDRTSRMQRYMLHLRLLHSRIYLYRPMLFKLYTMKPKPQAESAALTSLSERLLKEYAGMCVEAAQRVISLVAETLDSNEPIGVIPWWNRVYFLHIAGVIFLAAMVSSDLFTDSVSRSWQDVLAALGAHVHLSTYVQQCVWTFETLSARILQTSSLPLHGGCEPLSQGAACSLDGFFQDVRFDFDDFLFGSEDAADSFGDLN